MAKLGYATTGFLFAGLVCGKRVGAQLLLVLGQTRSAVRREESCLAEESPIPEDQLA